ncbi:MAG TPA: metallophosphoesterase [Anaerovoracaceae bacterium]|nr:metallophosphoesterase [Anaerovoracaceae bacterium]
MSFPVTKVPSGTRIAVIGDIHEHREHFDKILERINPGPKTYVISVGDVYDKGFGPTAAEGIIDTLKPLIQDGYAAILRGNHELKVIRKARGTNTMNPYLDWMDKQPTALTFGFANNTHLTVVHGGVMPSHTWNNLFTDIETCYVRNLDEKGKMIKKVWKKIDGKDTLVPEKPGGLPWHRLYDGRFGYIASGHDAQRDGVPKFYNYSCNIDTAVYDTGIMTAQIFSENGREDLIMVSGTAKKPQL